jgi:LPS export ABC transporter protein LptC
MKSQSSEFRSFSLIATLFSVVILVLSCENRISLIPKSDLLTLPSQTVKDFETILTDSGRTQMIMSSPLVERYDKGDRPYSEFRSGINVDLYNGQKNPVARVTAKYGKFTNSDNLWELRDSVVVINENNEKLETEVLFWNQQKDLIYTDRFVKITSEDEIIQGIGFESDSHLNKQRIKKVTAEIYLKDEK